MAIVDNEYHDSDLYSVFSESILERAKQKKEKEEREGQDGALVGHDEDLEGSVEI